MASPRSWTACSLSRSRPPAQQWVRVVGGWNEYQFPERRPPALDEINAAAPKTPVMITNHYDRGFLNRAALLARQ